VVPVADSQGGGEEGQHVAGDGHLRHDVVTHHVCQGGAEVDHAHDVHEASQQAGHLDNLREFA
jgi:hypothetical protein